MRKKIIMGVVALMIAGFWGNSLCEPAEATAAEPYRQTVPTAYEALYLRECRYGKAEDDIDSLIAEAIAVIEATPKEPERIYLGLFWVTGYDLCVQCCGIWSAEHPSRQGTDYVQTTASGVPNCVGVTVAAGKEFAFGTRLYIEGVGERVVQDRGVGNGCIDVLCHNHADCADVTGWREVWIIP